MYHVFGLTEFMGRGIGHVVNEGSYERFDDALRKAYFSQRKGYREVVIYDDVRGWYLPMSVIGFGEWFIVEMVRGVEGHYIVGVVPSIEVEQAFRMANEVGEDYVRIWRVALPMYEKYWEKGKSPYEMEMVYLEGR